MENAAQRVASSNRMMKARAEELMEKERHGDPWDKEEDRRWFEAYRKRKAAEAEASDSKNEDKGGRARRR
jgi:hypothetical protein